MTLATIREDLKDIRYYYSRQKVFDKALISVGENIISAKIKRYNDAIRQAPPRLYDLYVSLYLENNTQDSLSEKLGYTVETISRLNSQLVRFFQKTLVGEEVWFYYN